MNWACVVCGTPLTRQLTAPAGPHPICHAVPCRMVIEQAASMSEAAFKQHLQWRARNIRAQKAQARADALRLQAKIEDEARENDLWWATLERLTPGHAPDRFMRLTLPIGPRQQSNLALRRQRRYRDHVNRLIAQAMVSKAPPPDLSEHLGASASIPEPTPAERLTGHVCALCQGGCCSKGGDTAYLSPDTIRRFMALHPQLRPRDVLAAYLDRLSPRTQQGSCINHTSQGCSLPREMRSDTCNHYLCATQKDLHSRLEDDPPLRGVIAIQRQQDHWRRDALDLPNPIVGRATVTESGITPWPASP